MAVDMHMVVTTSTPPTTVLLPNPFSGIIDENEKLSKNVNIMGMPAATVESTASNIPQHIPPGGGSFEKPPSNQGKIITGSQTVFINGKPAARAGDKALTCNDPADLPVGTVMVVNACTVLIG